MRLKRYQQSGLTILALIGLAVLGLAVGASLAQQPQGPWPSLEASFSPEEVPTGEGFLTTLTLRNEGTESATIDEVTVEFPAGIDYVGQAFGSDVADPAEVSPSQLRWTGPFNLAVGAELELRFWATVTGQASPGPYPVLAVALSGDGSPVSSEGTLNLIPGAEPAAPPVQPTAVEKVAAEPSAVQVTKTAVPEEVDPGDEVLYTVTFNNGDNSPVTLDTITDELPAGFAYVGLAHGSQIGDDPFDLEEPALVWAWEDPAKRPEVPAKGTLVLRYWVKVLPETPVSSTPYTNQVMASYSATPVGPAYADVWIGEMVLAPPPPTNVQASDGTFTDKVRVTWNAVSGATSYEVYRATSLGGQKAEVGSPTGTSYDDTGTAPGVTIYYWVKACDASGCSDYSAPDTGFRKGYRAYLPLVARPEEPVTTLPFVDTFAQLSPNWVVFTTPTGPYANQWIWGPAGLYWYDPDAGGHSWDDFALSMYLSPGAQNWSDYQVVTALRLRDDRLGGLWVRGTYQGGNLGGYYVHIQPRNDTVYLWRFPPGSTLVDDATVVNSNDYGPGINEQQWYNLKVVVQGNNIRAWLKSVGDPESAYRLLINWTDSNSTWMRGTVGLSAYKAFTVYDEIRVTEYP